jgi:hypothetical protein
MKLETRNPKLENKQMLVVARIQSSNFGFVSDFEVRASNFLLPNRTLGHE